MESCIPAKVYDYLATGIPVLAVCPPGAALLQIPEARRFHHVHHGDIDGLVTLLRRAMRDRKTLRAGSLGEGPTREQGVETLSHHPPHIHILSLGVSIDGGRWES